MKAIFAGLAVAALLVSLGATPARAADQQTFWSISTGPVPSPWPTPTYWPANWYGVWYYPVFWPLCSVPAAVHCRPPRAHVWPPHVPAGHVPIPKPPR